MVDDIILVRNWTALFETKQYPAFSPVCTVEAPSSSSSFLLFLSWVVDAAFYHTRRVCQLISACEGNKRNIGICDATLPYLQYQP